MLGRISRCSPQKLLVCASVTVLALWVILSLFVIRSHHQDPATSATSTSVGGFAGNRVQQSSQGSDKRVSSPKTTAASRESSAASRDVCRQRHDCLQCLFPTFNVSERFSAAAGDCVWCASTKSCVAQGSADQQHCEDLEEEACPAVLVTAVPQNHRVLHVGIRKGGPEALVQLHLALHHWGFKTTLDTRKSMKEKGGPVMPFFLEAYREEFARAPPLRWVKNYDDWHASAVEGDVLIATETWACKNDPSRYLPKGVRQFQWHLTVWPRRDRSQCTIAGHTNYVARDYMRQSVRSLMYPYISPHIIALAKSRFSWKDQKSDLVLYDSDTHLKDADLESRRGVARERKIASGYTPTQLYSLYQRAKVGIDLQLPGGERFVYEAALFDVCVIVDDALNGADHEDFPIPERFRVKPNNLDALNAAVDECIRDYDRVISEFEPLKQLVLKQRVTFLRQVRRYFSNSAHIVTVACSSDAMNAAGVRFLLATLIQVPFAVIEFFVPPGVSLHDETRKLLHDNSLLSAVIWTEMDPRLREELCDGGGTSPKSRTATLRTAIAQLRPSTNEKRSLITLVLPIEAVMMSDDVVHHAVSQLSLQARATPSPSDHVPLWYLEGDVGNPEREWAVAAYFSRDAAAVALACRRGAARCTAPELHPQAIDRAAAHFSLLRSDGSLPWGNKQMWDESVKPLFCSHELWRTLVGHSQSPPEVQCASAP